MVAFVCFSLDTACHNSQQTETKLNSFTTVLIALCTVLKTGKITTSRRTIRHYDKIFILFLETEIDGGKKAKSLTSNTEVSVPGKNRVLSSKAVFCVVFIEVLGTQNQLKLMIEKLLLSPSFVSKARRKFFEGG